jgi:hypothetical protein
MYVTGADHIHPLVPLYFCDLVSGHKNLLSNFHEIVGQFDFHDCQLSWRCNSHKFWRAFFVLVDQSACKTVQHIAVTPFSNQQLRKNQYSENCGRLKPDSHIPCRSPAALKAHSHIPCRSPAATLPFSDSAVSFVKVRVVDRNIRTASLLLVTTFVEIRVVAGRSRTRAGRPQASVDGRC